MDIGSWIGEAWDRHADAPGAVADELASRALPAVDSAENALRLARLAHHVQGEHLGRWAEAIELQHKLAALPLADDALRAATARHIAALRVCAGDATALPAAGSERAAVAAQAAAALAPHDGARAGALLQQAADAASALADDDPAHRALAVAGNNIAGTLAEKPTRGADETALMLQAAALGRRHWALAGTWLEIERAEYRLALCHLAAGDLARAQAHAQACLAIVEQQGNPPLERFFAFEPLAGVARARGDAAALAHARTEMQAAFEALPADDQGWCRATLEAAMRDRGPANSGA